MDTIEIPSFITVRTSSNRLPQKCLLPFGEECNVLEHIIRRCKFYKLEPIVCTSVDPSDDVIEKIAGNENVKCFRGSLINKLKRWLDCCIYFNVEKFHTVDADDPFFDGNQVKKSYAFLDNGYDMVCPTESSSGGAASVGYSMTRKIIEKACANISENEDTEMMWYYVEKIKNLKKKDLDEENKSPQMRLTLDYEEDYWLLESVRRIVGNLASRKEVDDLFLKNPDLYKINLFRNEEWKKGQLDKKV